MGALVLRRRLTAFTVTLSYLESYAGNTRVFALSGGNYSGTPGLLREPCGKYSGTPGLLREPCGKYSGTCFRLRHYLERTSSAAPPPARIQRRRPPWHPTCSFYIQQRLYLDTIQTINNGGAIRSQMRAVWEVKELSNGASAETAVDGRRSRRDATNRRRSPLRYNILHSTCHMHQTIYYGKKSKRVGLLNGPAMVLRPQKAATMVLHAVCVAAPFKKAKGDPQIQA